MDQRESLAVDLYLDGLLARRAGARPMAIPMTADLPPAIIATADLLDHSLLRFHPSFRFEEGLAERLRAEAAGCRLPAPPGRLLDFPGPSRDFDPGPSRRFETSQEGGDRRARSLLVGGAIASGVSLAGAALLAWRRGRGPGVAAGVTGERAL